MEKEIEHQRERRAEDGNSTATSERKEDYDYIKEIDDSRESPGDYGGGEKNRVKTWKETLFQLQMMVRWTVGVVGRVSWPRGGSLARV